MSFRPREIWNQDKNLFYLVASNIVWPLGMCQRCGCLLEAVASMRRITSSHKLHFHNTLFKISQFSLNFIYTRMKDFSQKTLTAAEQHCGNTDFYHETATRIFSSGKEETSADNLATEQWSWHVKTDCNAKLSKLHCATKLVFCIALMERTSVVGNILCV